MEDEGWYNKGYNLVLSNIVEEIIGAKDPDTAARHVYSYLNEEGFIDYDIEKEIFWSWFGMASNNETDPTGRNPHEPGAKLDAGKPCIWQGGLAYFPRAIREVAAVSTFGATKYAWKGWETVPDGFNRYSDAMVRHLIDEGRGEVYDRDSGLVHAAHTAWNALARLELLLKNGLK